MGNFGSYQGRVCRVLSFSTLLNEAVIVFTDGTTMTVDYDKVQLG